MPAQRQLVPVLVLAALAAAGPARAQGAEIGLQVVASPAGCVREAELAAAVETLLDRPVVTGPADVELTVRIRPAPTDGHWLAAVTLRDVAGAHVFRLVRRAGASCRVLDEPLELLVAGLVDPRLLFGVPAVEREGAAEVDDAWELYHDAVVTLAAGRAREARWVLRRLIDRYPGHPAAGPGLDMLQVMDDPHRDRPAEAVARRIGERAVEGGAALDAPRVRAR